MTSRLGWKWAVLSVVSLAMYAGCDRPPARVVGPPFSPSSEASKAMELFDTNKDGKIAGPELDKAPGLMASLNVMKTNKNQGVTSDQIVARIQKWKDWRVGRTTLSCTVLRNGQPLAGATVKFVPEKFLADALPETATGQTNETGKTMPTLPAGADNLPPGVGPGMYRVEITKDGENIPPQYNTATILGQEVAPDNMEQMGIKYNLQY
jgi:hypothetical protein